MNVQPKLAQADEASPALDIYRQFRGLIVSGQLGAGERLPTVRQTASDLGVAAGTAARAYKMLEAEGLVVSRTAAGTRVAESAGVLPGPLIRRVRDVVEEAVSAGAHPDDVVDVLRAIWQARAVADTDPESRA
ncbi:GntR family transcriptional regulator [Microbacterium sp. SA39]|uniref:GntR family transcriptional regulator n=1 Tax=Microbacterium sp. SA39 TaxID=1263625 RepID=UPI00061E1F3D|nr:GntR family transcriptional regulator [Microbacterium sp. SA39]KJQ55215.1 putative HTH-type transcriptional regulator YdcR [Microbacterium sp. SA39]